MSEIKQHWQKIELNEILSISSKKFNPIGNNENKKCVELEHLSQETGKLLGYTNSSEQQSIKNSFEEGQILFGKLRPYLKKFWKAEFEGVCSSEIWVMNGKKVKNDFLFYLVQTEKFNQIANVSSGSKMPRADWNYMSEIPFDIPPLKEQEKIAEILTTWDEAITKQTELLEAKELQKKALMQKLLSGEVRFDGFSDKWEEVRIDKLFDFKKGQELSKEKLEKNGIFECILYGELYTTYSEVISEIKSKTNIKEGIKSKIDDILIPASTTTSAIDLAIASTIQKDNVLIGGDINILRKKTNNINGEFISKYLTHIKKMEIAKYAQGITIIHLYSKDFKHLKIKLPSLPEQQKIAEVLSLADDEINLLKNELEELKLQKKALMQKLLTGEVRVKV
jgi:type I restriction enzyme, S subunit